MVIKISDLGGTNWADGDILFSADLIDTFGATILHRKQFSDATERTTTNTSFENSGTAFTLSIPINSMIIGFEVEMDLKETSDRADTNLQISGSNLGTKYLIADEMRDNAGNFSVAILSSTENNLLSNNTGSYVTFRANQYTPLKILDTSTTLTIRIKTESGSGGTASIQNVVVDVLYIEAFKED